MNQICAKDFELWNLHSACSKGKDIEECKRCWRGALKWHKSETESTIEPWPEPIDEGMPVRQAVELLGNYKHCLNPPKHHDEHDCPSCTEYYRCVYYRKDDYRKVKL